MATCSACQHEVGRTYDTIELNPRSLCSDCFALVAVELIHYAKQIKEERAAFEAELGEHEQQVKECLSPWLRYLGEPFAAGGLSACYVANGAPTQKIEIPWEAYQAMLRMATEPERVVLHRYLSKFIKISSGRSAYVRFGTVKEQE